MRDADLIEAMRAIIDAGGVVTGSVPVAGGYRSAIIEADDAALFVHDNRTWVAKAAGVTPEQLFEYERYEGLPRCGAKTLSGGRCLNSVTGQCDPDAFVQLHGDRCRVHA